MDIFKISDFLNMLYQYFEKILFQYLQKMVSKGLGEHVFSKLLN
jgi:hypothetical protein